MSEPTPTGLTADREAMRLTITWDTGETCSLPFDLLRNACPCAQCRGGHQNMKSEPDEDVFIIPLTSVESTRLVSVEAVGGYAISIAWGDGHSAGIYTWHYLRVLCQKMEEEKQN